MGLRRVKALLGLYGLIFLSVLIQSCCEEDLLITSVGYMSAWKSADFESGSGSETIYTITGEFYLDVGFHQKVVAANNYTFMGSAYATSCKENMLNEIDENSLFLAIDHSFVHNEDTIPQNTNLLDLEGSGIEWNVNDYGTVIFHFTDDFFDRSTLENGDYTFSFEGHTSDHTHLASEIELAVLL